MHIPEIFLHLLIIDTSRWVLISDEKEAILLFYIENISEPVGT
jgi:hypothetical protein